MTSYEKIWDTAEDNHGVITSAQARRLGVKPAALVSMASNRKLIRVGQGVYKLEHHVPGPFDEYAQAVAMAGEFYLGVTKRMRRKLPSGYAVKIVAEPDIEYVEGIPVERVGSAVADARASGAVDVDRLRELEAAL